MNIPGFTAEAVFKTEENFYRSASPIMQAGGTEAVIPQTWECIALGVVFGIAHPLLGLLVELACDS